jgi:hypothetical protein
MSIERKMSGAWNLLGWTPESRRSSDSRTASGSPPGALLDNGLGGLGTELLTVGGRAPVCASGCRGPEQNTFMVRDELGQIAMRVGELHDQAPAF